MKNRILNFVLLLTSLFGYLEWGGGNASFLFQAEAQIFEKLFSDPISAIHPFVLVPMVGQVILLVTLFQKNPGKVLTFTGIGCIAILLVFMFVIGVISLNFRILLSTIPFLFVSVVSIRYNRRRNVFVSGSSN